MESKPGDCAQVVRDIVHMQVSKAVGCRPPVKLKASIEEMVVPHYIRHHRSLNNNDPEEG